MSASACSPWLLRGSIVKGHQRGGSMLGFPTANVKLDAETMRTLDAFRNTVWAGWAVIEQPPAGLTGVNIDGMAASWNAPSGTVVYPTVLSVGTNPHFKDVTLTVEPYLLQKFNADFYGCTLRVVACACYRVMGAYTTVEALIAQIRADCDTGSRLLEQPAPQEMRQLLVDETLWRDDAPALRVISGGAPMRPHM